MRPWLQVLGVGGFVILFGFLSCGRQDGRLHAGDTVIPRLQGPIHWTAGATGDLRVRLCAKAVDAETERLLDFSAVGLRVNPMANIAFYSGDQRVGSQEVILSHRC